MPPASGKADDWAGDGDRFRKEATDQQTASTTVDQMVETVDKPVVDRLISVAGEIFAEKGPAATVRQICSAAGCSVAAINYHFGDKHNLYVRCVEKACESKQKLFPLPDLGSEERSVGDWKALLQSFLRAVCSRIAAKSNVSWHNTLMLREVLAPSEGVAEILEKPFRRDMEKLSSLLSRLLGPELDSQDLRRSLLTQIVARCMFLRTGKNIRRMIKIDSATNEDPVSYADDICNSILNQIDAVRGTRGSPPEVAWSSPDTLQDTSWERRE